MTSPCPHCGQSFGDANGLFNHTKAKHGRKAARAVRPVPEREQSMASLLIEAQLQHAMGEPVDDWLMDMFPESFEDPSHD